MEKVMKILTLLLLALIITNIAPAQNTKQYIVENEITNVQQKWAEAIVTIGRLYIENKDYKTYAAKVVDNLYGYDEGVVLFKPTKVSQKQFRLTEEEALSYFITGIVPEDHGFALQPQEKVRFENAGIIINGSSALVMGNYFFTDAKNGNEVKVEFTFGYFKNESGELLINLHHSSLPYNPVH